jgi:ABC-type uncharacterized transport system permease subunit
MSLESRRERLIYQGAIPVVAAIAGAMAATWFQSASIDQAQLHDVVALLQDPKLTSAQKLQALEIYKEITDRPWGIIRSLTSTLTTAAIFVLTALVMGGFFRKQG